MNKLTIYILLSLMMLFIGIELDAAYGRIELGKPGQEIEEGLPKQQRKVHPAQSLFPKRTEAQLKTRDANFNRLLVLLVDFQEYDDPKTTGNGKFVLDFDPDYPVSLGAPPRDYQYFDYHLQAMRYYYLAASLGSYDLEYDIYPAKGDETKFAYTLPQRMRYYNPGMDNPALFVERAEEYFQDVFRVADSYEEIDFSDYGHFLFIHAGSDWQHDVYGDTPHDLPSFFITVAEGKEAVVNNGNVKISSAANVPETISQDDRYGVINGTLFHEFGHSLGFVDLYNVSNGYPGVGYYDIMDSGGSIAVNIEGLDGEIYSVQGVIPALPSAWHRYLAFGDYYKHKGYFRYISDFAPNEAIEIAAASAKPAPGDEAPYIVKVPLTNKEYLLLENRNVDPDGDGGTSVKGAYPLTEDGNDYRVALHPVAINDDFLLNPTYEYDFLLPSWVSKAGASFGGGIFAWHIDETILYDEGVTYEDGTFRNNYQLNRVNIDYYNRAIRIIEADNIKDIGNPASWYWRGTPYEGFFRYKPNLIVESVPVVDGSGRVGDDIFFNGWSYQEHNRTLSGVSQPPLLSNSGYPALYSIYDISSVAKIMSFKYRFGIPGREPYETTHIIATDIKPTAIAAPGPSADLQLSKTLPVFTKEGVKFLRWFDEVEQWEDFFGIYELDYKLSQLPVTIIGSNGYTCFYIPSGNELIVLEEQGLSIEESRIVLEGDIVEPVMVVDVEGAGHKSQAPYGLDTHFQTGTRYTRGNPDKRIIVSTEERIYIIDEATKDVITTLPIPNAHLSYDGETLYAVSDGKLYLVEGSSLELRTGAVSCPYKFRDESLRSSLEKRHGYKSEVARVFTIPQYDNDYKPVSYKDVANPELDGLFIQNRRGDIYNLRAGEWQLFFSVHPYTADKPTQLAFIQSKPFEANSNEVELGFAAGNYLFMVDINGALAAGYPKYYDDKMFTSKSHPRAFRNNNNDVILMLEVENEGYLAYNQTTGYFDNELSLVWDRPESNDLLAWDSLKGELSFIFADNQNKVYESIILQDTIDNPLIWNGYRNLGWSMFAGRHNPGKDKIAAFDAFAFPNPVAVDEVRIRITGAQADIDINIFDISGKIVYSGIKTYSSGNYQDVPISVGNLSSGVYFGTAAAGRYKTTFNLAVER